MPWQCSKCQTEVTEDDLTCPKCETDKTSWTLIPDKTRTFTVSGRKVTLMRGTQAETLAADDPNQEGAAALVKVDAIPAVPKAVAAEAAARGHRPASRDLLRVRLHPRKQTDWTVKLAVEFETDEVAEHEFPRQADPDFDPADDVDVPFLFVFGEGDEVVFEGIHVVDVGEETDLGHAPTLEVTALRKTLRAVPVEAIGDKFLSAQFFDRAGRAPAANLAFKVGGKQGQTDAQGVAVLDGMPWEDLIVEFDDGWAIVPAVHDAGILCRTLLRFLEPGEPADEDSDDPPPPDGVWELPSWHAASSADGDDEPDDDEPDDDEDDDDEDFPMTGVDFLEDDDDDLDDDEEDDDA